METMNAGAVMQYRRFSSLHLYRSGDVYGCLGAEPHTWSQSILGSYTVRCCTHWSCIAHITLGASRHVSRHNTFDVSSVSEDTHKSSICSR